MLADFKSVPIEQLGLDERGSGVAGLARVVFQYSIERSCRFSIVRTQQSAKTLAAAHRSGTGFWNSVNQLIAQETVTDRSFDFG